MLADFGGAELKRLMKKIAVVWFKVTDLRTHDHAALCAAREVGSPCGAPRAYLPGKIGKSVV